MSTYIPCLCPGFLDPALGLKVNLGKGHLCTMECSCLWTGNVNPSPQISHLSLHLKLFFRYSSTFPGVCYHVFLLSVAVWYEAISSILHSKDPSFNLGAQQGAKSKLEGQPSLPRVGLLPIPESYVLSPPTPCPILYTTPELLQAQLDSASHDLHLPPNNFITFLDQIEKANPHFEAMPSHI